MKASDLVVRCLEKEGVEYVFAVPGEENLDFVESLRTSSIKLIVNRHEQGSAFMAATYARLTGKIGVCMSTLGPGATNLVTGIAHAQLGGWPVLAITGQKGIRENWQADFQVLDVVEMMKPLTKRSLQLHGPKAIPKEIREAVKVVTSPKMGVCHIEIPEDIAAELVDEQYQPQEPPIIRQTIADQKAIDIAAQKIRDAKHPIIIVSSRAQDNYVQEALKQLCNATNMYVIHTQLGKGVLGDDHKNSLYAFGIHKHDYVNCVVDRADLIVTIGYSTIEHPPSVWNKQMNKHILHIDEAAADNDVYYNPCAELIGHIPTSLYALKDALQGFVYDGTAMEQTKHDLENKLFNIGSTDDAFPLKPRRIVADCRKILNNDDIICMDNGIYKMWFSRHYKTFKPNTFLLDNTLATMGAGLPCAMAAKLINPEKKVLAVCGDGGFMMNSQEIETAVRLGINVVVLIVTDNAYGFIKWKQQNHGFDNFALDLGNPDFVKYAQSYGAVGLRVQSAQDLVPTLHKAFDQHKPVIIECPIDYAENHEVWNKELDNIVCNL